MNPYTYPPRVLITEIAPALLAQLQEDTPRLWGKMSPQHMVEHVSMLFFVSRRETPIQIFTPEDKIEKAKQFLWNEKPFRQNTVGPGLPEEPSPLRFSSLDEAKGRLIDSIGAYYQFFAENPDKKTIHPVFGYLNQEEWERFHYKHIIHHFTQFGLIEAIAPEQV